MTSTIEKGECWAYILIVFIKNMCQYSSRKEQNEGAISSRDLYSKAQRERMDNLDQANQEIDRLRKQVDKLQAELQGKITKNSPVFVGASCHSFNSFA
jgi:septation ring formation regulator EzrA